MASQHFHLDTVFVCGVEESSIDAILDITIDTGMAILFTYHIWHAIWMQHLTLCFTKFYGGGVIMYVSTASRTNSCTRNTLQHPPMHTLIGWVTFQRCRRFQGSFIMLPENHEVVSVVVGCEFSRLDSSALCFQSQGHLWVDWESWKALLSSVLYTIYLPLLVWSWLLHTVFAFFLYEC